MIKKFGNTFCSFFKLSKNKGIEIQLTFEWDFADWFELSLKTRRKCDHAGTTFTLEILRIFYFHIMYYDFRHWDDDNDKFCEYD
jgi:hypothetical protein